jgi:hypothetical protein
MEEERTITITLTESEAEVVDNYIFRKACRLEDANLKETHCYPRLYRTHQALSRALKELRESK